MHLRALPVITVLATVFTLPVAATFADEAYQIDYHYPLLGPPTPQNTFFHRPSTNSKAALIYTLSERNILGAVNPKDGALLWRQRLLDERQNATAPAILKVGEAANLVVSAVEGKVQAWDAIDGRLVWESRGLGKVKALEVLPEPTFEEDVLVVYQVDGNKAIVKRLAASSGVVKWTHEDISGNAPFALVSAGEVIYYVSLHSGLLGRYKIHVTQLDLLSIGNVPVPTAQPADAEVISEDSIVYVGSNAGTPLLVWTDKTFKTVKINVIGSKHVTTVSVTPKAEETVKKILVHATGMSGAQPHFLIHYQCTHSNWAEVFHVIDSKVSKAFDLPHVGGRGAFSACSLAKEVYLVRYTTSEVILYSSKGAAVLTQWDIQSDTPNVRDPVHGISEVIMRAGAKYSLRSALVLPSGDWELVRNGDSLWSRPEGLAGVVAAGFVDVAHKEDLLETLASESQRNLLGAYVHRVKRHLKQMQHLPNWLQGLPSRILPDFFGIKAEFQDQDPLHQGFGFNKVVIVATERGRLAALDTGQHGKVLWSIRAADVPAGQVWDVLSIDPEERFILVRGNSGEFLRVNSSSGVILAYQPGSMIASLRTSIIASNLRGVNGHLPINRDGSLGNVLNADFPDGTIVVTEGEDNIVRGWKPVRDGESTLAWQFVPDVGEDIQSVQPPPSHDPIASIGKALGDRNVLYKYLNPNLLLITTTVVQTSTVSFYVVDSTSGAVLYSAAHTGVDIRQPISSTLTENWLAYSLFSESRTLAENSAGAEQKTIRSYQLVISELFESRFPNDRGPLRESVNSSSFHPIVAEENELGDNPHVISQTFLLPGPISHMTTTSTLQGITPRSLLCVLPQANALMSIPRHFIDPRRPVGRDPTQAEAEEGLFRYSPLLEFEPKWLLNHKRDLFGISSVITSPSNLESTSLVFAYGDVDLFGTRVSPIGSFDMLGKGFSKLQLVGTVLALAVGTSLLAPFVRRKQIDGQWKA